LKGIFHYIKNSGLSSRLQLFIGKTQSRDLSWCFEVNSEAAAQLKCLHWKRKRRTTNHQRHGTARHGTALHSEA